MCLWAGKSHDPECHSSKHLAREIRRGNWASRRMSFSAALTHKHNRTLFYQWKTEAAAAGKVTRSNGKYYRAYPEKETVN